MTVILPNNNPLSIAISVTKLLKPETNVIILLQKDIDNIIKKQRININH